MNLSGKGALIGDKTASIARTTTLNPNAAEFVPSSVKSVPGSISTAEVFPKLVNSSSTTLGKAALDRSQSSVSNNSDDEAHQYWRQQLPDDITPDFKVTGDDDALGINNLSFSSLLLTDGDETRFPALPSNGFMRKDHNVLSPRYTNGNSLHERSRYPVSSYGENLTPGSLYHFSSKPWDKQTLNHDQLLSNVPDGAAYGEKSRHGSMPDMMQMNGQQIVEIADANPLDFLASHFPGFATESLAEVYFANGCNLNLTIEMLTQLELQVDGDLTHSKAFASPILSSMDFPALATAGGQNSLQKYVGDDIQQNASPYRSSERNNLLSFKSDPFSPSRGAIDFASAVKKMSPQDPGLWKYENNGSVNANVGSSRSSHILASSYHSDDARGMYSDRAQNRGSGRPVPLWVETGEAVANLYSKMREEARDHARLRNAFFEQASQAYLIGNKALAKELSAKGQLHNEQMKTAHGKAQDSIYRHRNPVGLEIQGNGRVPERTIDLHGLHVSEALHVLKRELAALRNAARAVDQRVQVYICVGTGHHTRGSRTPARLPIAVQRYLLEEEGLDYSEPQPGLLRVVIY